MAREFDNIAALIERNAQNGNVSLFEGLPEQLNDKLSTALPMIDVCKLVVTEPLVNRTASDICVSGKTTLLGVGGTSMSVTVMQQRNKLSLAIDLTFPDEANISLPAFPQWGIAKLRFTLAMRGLNKRCPASVAALFGTIKMGALEVPVTLAVPQAGEQWRLRGDFNTLPLPGISSIASLLGLDDIPAFVPPSVQALSEFSLEDIDITLGAGGISRASLQVHSLASLHLDAAQITLDDIRLGLEIKQPMEAAERSLHGQISGQFSIGDVAVAVSINLPPGSGGLQLSTPFGASYSLPDLTDLTNQLLPNNFLPGALTELAQLEISHFTCALDTDTFTLASINFALRSTSALTIIPNVLSLQQPSLLLNILYPFDAEQRAVFGSFRGQLTIGGHSISVNGEVAEHVSLNAELEQLSLAELLMPWMGEAMASLSAVTINHGVLRGSTAGDISISAAIDCDFSALALAIGIPLPDAVTHIALSRLALSRHADNQSWQLDITSDNTIPLNTGEKNGAQIIKPSLQITHTKVQGMQFSFSFELNGVLTICDEVSIKCDSILFAWDQREGRWSVKGSVAAIIVGNEYKLEASIDLRDGSNTIALKYPNELPLSDLGGAGSVSIRDLCVRSEKHSGDDDAQSWGMSGGAKILIDHLCEVDGEISVQSSREGRQLQLSAKAPTLPPIKLPIDLPEQPELRIALDDLAIRYAKDSSGKANWSLTSAAHLQITHIPDVVKSYLPPETLNGFLRADGKTTAIGFDVPSTLQPQFPELALTFANDYKLSLGKPEISVTAIELHLGDQPKLVQKISAQLPPQLNHIFGFDKNGKPNLDLFNESFDVNLVMAKKLALTIVSSPIKPLEFYKKDLEKDGDDGLWTMWNFGDIGKVEFRVPEFSFSGGRWNAGCGFNRLTDIGLPLRPIKFLLEKCGFPSALNTIIPNSLLLKDVDFTGDNFAREMKRLLGDDVLGRLDKNASHILNGLFDAVKGVIDRLPTRLQDYLKVRIPKSAIMEISVDSTGGGTSVALRTLTGDPPLTFLFPMMLGLPELMGVTLRGFSFGQKMGGALALIEFDGHVDRIDMVSLTAALTMGKQDISNRYILDKTLLAVPTALPIPIPLFFDNIGLDYRDILGFDIQARWSYPDPQLGVFESISLFSELMQFFKQPDYLLHKEGFGKTLGLELTIGQNFISLPGYLGGQTLGLQKALPTLSVGDSIARFLDFLKTGNAGYAITAIPLKHKNTWIRIGSQEIHFGPLVIGMSWCISTDEEFVETIIPASESNKDLPVKFDNAVLESLPKSDDGSSYSKGFIILLMGHANIGSVAGLRTEFGIAVTAQGGFETGFRIAGEIGGALMLQISGAIQADQTSVTVKGSTGLYWKDSPLIASSGRITVSDTALEIEIVIELGPNFSLAGLLIIGNQGFLMSGKANWGHGAEGPSEGIGAAVQFAADGMTITFDWTLFSLDGEVRIRVPGDGHLQLFSAAVVLKPNVALQESFATGIKSIAKSAAEDTVDQVYNDLQNALADVDSLEGSIAGLRKWLPPLCKSIIATINRSISANTRGWKKPGRKPAQRKARPYINRIARLRDVAEHASDKTIRSKLKSALNAIIKYNRLSISYRIGWPVNKRFTIYNRDLMNSKQLKQLRTAVQWIDKLPAKDGMRIESQQIYDQLPARDKLLGEINRNINSGIDSAFPKIESMEFETSLGLVDAANLQVTVTYYLGGNKHIATTPLDVTNPKKMSTQLRDAFGT